jgi:hypothetical protein
MGKVWVLDTGTKGTGAQMLPLEKALPKAEPAMEPARPPQQRPRTPQRARQGPAPTKNPPERESTPLPPGHVRKKSTGEIGRVRSIDTRAGTATVLWLKHGQVSTVPLTAVSRR